MPKEKVCKHCKFIHEQEVCPNCGKKESLDAFKGKVEVINQEKSEIAKRLKINKNGTYAIKI